MAILTSKKPSETYKSLLLVGTGDNQELDSTLRVVEDGAGNDSALYLATDSVMVNGTNKLYFGDEGGEYIYGDNTDLRIYSGADVLLLPTGNVGIGVAAPESVSTTYTRVLEIGHDDDDTSKSSALVLSSWTSGGAEDVWEIGTDITGLFQFVHSRKQGSGTTGIKMTIDQTGNVGIGDVGPSYSLDVDGTVGLTEGNVIKWHDKGTTNVSASIEGTNGDVMYFKNTSSETLRLTIKADGDFVGSSSADISDERLKTNIISLTGSLDKINSLRGVSFTWKPEANKNTDKVYLGLLAQEVESYFPDVVRNESVSDTESTIYKSIHYTGLIAPMIKAIQELSAKVTALENA